jgi:arabinofuranan 3-O-arabinosyltransferase
VTASVVSYLVNLYPQTLDRLTDGNGRLFGDVFVNSWSAAYLTLHRRLAKIYDVNAFYAFEQSVVRPAVSGYHYSYPPVMLLISAPLSLIPYVPALFVWLTTSWYTFYRVLKGTMPEGGALVFSLATLAVLVNAVGGQNGDWNRGFCRRRPHSARLAGGLLGLMIYKPQLAILLAVAPPLDANEKRTHAKPRDRRAATHLGPRPLGQPRSGGDRAMV